MKRAWTCRRTFCALVGMSMLLVLGILGREQVAGSIATICMAVAAANATQGALEARAKGAASDAPK